MRREEQIARELAKKWDLTLGALLPGATCSLVRAATDRQNRDLVLKVPELHAEEAKAIGAMIAFSEFGGVGLINSDPETGSVLMPRLKPGVHLSRVELTDLEATDVCADLILRLRETPRIKSPSLYSFFDGFQARDRMSEDAVVIVNRLFDTVEEQTLLHGDLHHYNIVKSGENWVALDPKGIWGDPAYEVVAFMRNPVPELLDPSTLRARLHRFAERLGNPPERLWGWSFVQTVRSGQWAEEGGDFQTSWRCAAESLHQLRDEFWPKPR